MFDSWLRLWGLVRDGEPILNRGAHLLPVRRGEEPAMLKVAVEREDREGAVLMSWWNGIGAARVLAHRDEALLLERATGTRSLEARARNGRDDEASRIICAVAAELHAPRPEPLPALMPLAELFQELFPVARREGGILTISAETAERLLASQADIVPLHGDLHHGNVLDFGARGWLAIDPRRTIGERGFDFANIFENPDLPVAAAPGRLARQADVVADAARLDRRRLLEWVLAYSGLSAAWFIGDGESPELPLKVAKIAAAKLELGW